MIQRIQTIHLVLSVILGVVALILNFNTAPDCLMAKLFATPVESMRYVYLAMVALAVIAAVCSIFMYKKRPRQISVVNISTILLVLSYIVLGVCFYFNREQTLWKCFSLYLPLVSIVLNFMARRRIKYDENLVRSADRLR